MLRRVLNAAFFCALLAGGPAGANNLTILTEELPPINFTRDGQLTGLSVEIVREIARRIGQPDRIQVVPWARGYKLALENPDVVLFSTTRTEERETLFKWVGPLVKWSYVFYRRKGSTITLDNLDDAKRVGSIATYRDDAREQFLKEQGFTNLDSSPKLVSCARKLMEGRVDLWLDSNLTARQVLSELNYDPDDLEPVLAVKTNYLYIAFSKATDDAIVGQWQRALNEMARDGTLSKIYQPWLPGDIPPLVTLLDESSKLPRLRIYTEDLPPLSFFRDGALTGMSVEIVREALRRLEAPDTIELVPWSRGYKQTLEKSNVALFSTVRTSQRENLFKWAGPLLENNTVLYAKRGSGISISSLEDAAKVDSIGTYKDDADEQFLRENGLTNLYSHSNPVGIVRNLMAGRVKLWVAASVNAHQAMVKAGFSPEDFERVYLARSTRLYIAFSKKTPDSLVQRWQWVLDEMRRDGTFEAIRHKWLSPKISMTIPPPRLAANEDAGDLGRLADL